MAKQFRNLSEGDSVYILDPKPRDLPKIIPLDFERNPQKYIKHEILECKVTVSRPHPKTTRDQVWVLKIFLPNRLSYIMTPEKLLEAEKLGVKNTQETILVPREATMVSLINIRPLPTVMATTKEAIEQWMKKTK